MDPGAECCSPDLAADARDVGGGEFMLGMFEDVPGATILDEPTGTFLQPQQPDVIGDASGLGKVVGDDHDRIATPQGRDQVFHDAAGQRV